ncbi:MAG: polysaccharide biosynthesis/export family protein [Bacteroidales bacterium]|nr:polysaccharide biosynthesis/export family protein [Bacteroidales bacterium]
MKIKSLIIISGVALLLCSCASQKKILYFQDATNGKQDTIVVQDGRIKLQPDDVISIIVKSRDMNLTNLYNLPYYTQRLGSASDFSNNYSNGVTTYLVKEDGTIDFPVVGKIMVAGMTRGELANKIQDILIKGDYLKDPLVSIDYVNLCVSVLGEVAHPGRIKIDHDMFTVLDAITAAGDLTITGHRNNLRVLRNENGIQKTYWVNLNSADSLAKSPVYYLKQNDVVYAEPNKMRARQSTVNGNNVLNASFWVSVSSLAVTILLAVNQFAITMNAAKK